MYKDYANAVLVSALWIAAPLSAPLASTSWNTWLIVIVAMLITFAVAVRLVWTGRRSTMSQDIQSALRERS